MSNWVKTKCVFKIFDEEKHRDGLQRMFEDLLGTDKGNLLVYWKVVDEKDRIYVDPENVEIDTKKREIIIPMYSSWVLPEDVIKSIVEKFEVPCFFSWSDEFENMEKIRYPEYEWFMNVGSSGIGLCDKYDGSVKFVCFPPENERELHEIFLSSWDGTIPYDGGTRNFYNQNNIDDDYYFEKMRDCSFFSWLGKLLMRKITENR